MAFKIDKAASERLDQLAAKLLEERAALDQQIEEANDAIGELLEKVNEAIASHSETIEEVQGVLTDLHGEMEGEFSDKSERWQEGERGSVVQDWLSELEQLAGEFEPVEPVTLDPLAIEAEDHATILNEQLRSEPEF